MCAVPPGEQSQDMGHVSARATKPSSGCTTRDVGTSFGHTGGRAGKGRRPCRSHSPLQTLSFRTTLCPLACISYFALSEGQVNFFGGGFWCYVLWLSFLFVLHSFLLIFQTGKLHTAASATVMQRISMNNGPHFTTD